MRDKPDGAVELADGAWVDAADIQFSFARSGGPGGQAVNKLSTKVELRVALGALAGLSPGAAARLRRLAGRRLTRGGELVITSDTHRTQQGNRRACLERLAALVAEAVVEPKTRKPTRPPTAAVQRRLAEKRRHSERKSQRRPPEPEEE